MNDKEIEEVMGNIKFDMHKSYNGILLTDQEYDILVKYGFDANKYSSIESLIFDIENMLNEESDIDELENVLDSLSEFNYYHNTNK